MKLKLSVVLTTLIIVTLSYSYANSSKLSKFVLDFEYALTLDLDQEDLDYLFGKYPTLLLPQDSNIENYPLTEIKNNAIYKDNIDKLFNSKNPHFRVLGYLVISAAGDKSFESELLKKITTETRPYNVFWSGMALVNLKTEQTTVIFDYIVDNAEVVEDQLIQLYLQLNRDSLQQTAYSRIKSENVIASGFAARILSITELNAKTESLLKEAVADRDIGVKINAIYSIKELRIGNLLQIIEPLLADTLTRQAALLALANSPTKEDLDFLRSLSQMGNVVSKDILFSYLYSSNQENVIQWLEFIQSDRIPENYVFLPTLQPLLKSDDILPELHYAISNVSDAGILSDLVRLLKGRKDSTSVSIMIKLLHDDNSTVRYWSAFALKGNTSNALTDEIPKLLIDSNLRTLALIDLAIDNRIDTLQYLFDSIYADSPDNYWKRGSFEYMSNFPLERHRSIFVRILEGKEDGDALMNALSKRDAALGLGRLRDRESVDLIIDHCRRAIRSYDSRPEAYITALGMIKGDKAKEEIEKYKNSDNVELKVLVTRILNEW